MAQPCQARGTISMGKMLLDQPSHKCHSAFSKCSRACKFLRNALEENMQIFLIFTIWADFSWENQKYRDYICSYFDLSVRNEESLQIFWLPTKQNTKTNPKTSCFINTFYASTQTNFWERSKNIWLQKVSRNASLLMRMRLAHPFRKGKFCQQFRDK